MTQFSTPNLLKLVENNLSEGPLDALKGAFKHLTGGKSPAPETSSEPEAKVSNTSGISSLEDIVSRLVKTTDVRYVIFTNLSFFKAHYLGNGAWKNFVNDTAKLDDTALLAAVKGEATQEFSIAKLGSNFNFSSLVIPKTKPASTPDTAIQIDVPKTFSDKLEHSLASGDNKAIREILIAMMSFKFYVMSLKMKDCQSIKDKMDNADIEEQASIFNPYFIRNYPNKIVWDSAKEAYNEAHDEEGQANALLDKKKRDAERKQEHDEVDKKLGTGAMPTQTLKDEVIKVIEYAKDEKDKFKKADKIASKLKDVFKDKQKKDAIITELNILIELYGSAVLEAVKAKISNMTDWA